MEVMIGSNIRPANGIEDDKKEVAVFVVVIGLKPYALLMNTWHL